MDQPTTAAPYQRLVEALTCLALEPALGGLLFFDLDLDLLVPIASWFGALRAIQCVTARPRLCMLTAATKEDELWLTTRVTARNRQLCFHTQPSLLIETDQAAVAPVVLVPNLARLSLPATRAALQLVGAEVAHMERYGHSAQWRPRATWLVACSRAEISRVSTHLLDRFTLRIDAADLSSAVNRPSTGALPFQSIESIDRVALVHQEQVGLSWLPPLSKWRRVVVERPIPVTDEAIAHAVEVVGPNAPGARRELGLVLKQACRGLEAVVHLL